MTDEGILEKLWLVSEYGKGSPEDKVNEVMGLFNEQEKETTTVKWIEKNKSNLDWLDNINDLVERMLRLPKCPPKYRDNTWTPLEDKLKDSEYKEFYTEYQKRIEKVKKKHSYN